MHTMLRLVIWLAGLVQSEATAVERTLIADNDVIRRQMIDQAAASGKVLEGWPEELALRILQSMYIVDGVKVKVRQYIVPGNVLESNNVEDVVLLEESTQSGCEALLSWHDLRSLESRRSQTEAMLASILSKNARTLRRLRLSKLPASQVILSLISQCNSLQSLVIDTTVDNESVDWSGLTGLKELETLELHSKSVGDENFPQVGGRLISVNLSGTRLSESALKLLLLRAERLDELVIDDCRVMSLTFLRLCPEVRKLSIRGLDIKSLGGIDNCRSISHLDISGCVRLKSFREVGGLASLEVVGIGSLQISIPDAAALQSLPRLRIINCNAANFENGAFRAIALCEQVDEIYLRRSAFIAEDLPLNIFRWVRFLDMAESSANNEILILLATSSNIEELDIHGCKNVGKVGLEKIASSRNVRSLLVDKKQASVLDIRSRREGLTVSIVD